MKKVAIILGGLIAFAQASTYFVYMKRFLEAGTMEKGVEMVVWQVLTLFWPIVNGVMYVLADALWVSFIASAGDLMPTTELTFTYPNPAGGADLTETITFAPAADTIKAYFYFFGVVDGKTFSSYLMDYIVYGIIPETVPSVAAYLENDFYPIPLALGQPPHDFFCYYLNGYDPVSSPNTLPTYGKDYLWTVIGNNEELVEEMFAALDPPVTCTGNSAGEICASSGKDDPGCKPAEDDASR